MLCRPQMVRSCMVLVCDHGVDTPLCQAPTASSAAGLAQHRTKAWQMVQPLGTTVSSVQGGDVAAFLTPPEGEEELCQEAVLKLIRQVPVTIAYCNKVASRAYRRGTLISIIVKGVSKHVNKRLGSLTPFSEVDQLVTIQKRYY